MAALWALAVKLGMLLGGTLSWVAEPLVYMGVAGIVINIMLMSLNLLPLPPLDGGRIVTGLLPGPLAAKFARVEPYGLIILLALLLTGWLGKILLPVISFFASVLVHVAGIPGNVL